MDSFLDVPMQEAEDIEIDQPGHDSNPGDMASDDLFFEHIARFYLMLEAYCLLSETTIQCISEHLALMSEFMQNQIKQCLRKELQGNGISENVIVSVLNSVLTSDKFYSAHHKNAPGPSLTSEYLRKQYFKNNFKYVKPVEVPLDRDREGGAVVHYIPIKQTLELLLQDPSVADQIEESFTRTPSSDSYRDYYDGRVCQSRESSKIAERIDILLYQDGFGLAKNALGSAAKKLQITGSYFTIGNLKPHNRSKIQSINLALLIKSQILKENGTGKCFKPLLDDLKDLALKGIKFKDKIIPVFMQFMAADNLGAHMAFGHLESFSAIYFCRFCEITREEFQNAPHTLKPLRTVQDYEAALQHLYRQREKEDVLHYKGLKQNSEFNEVPHFHACDPGFPVCIAHDVFEGILSWDLRLIIDNLVKKGWFSLKHLCALIEKFKYLDSDCGNKPAPVKKDSTGLGGHAVQNWTLMRLFPFIIESKIKNKKDKVWLFFLKLKRMVDCMCAPCFSEKDIDDLRQFTKEYFQSRAKVFPDASKKPKLHFVNHYPDLIRLCGPLVYLWTLRFEAKHQFFKAAARVANNVINLGHTLAEKHQLWFCYLTSGVMYPKGVQHMDKSNKLDINSYSKRICSTLQASNLGSALTRKSVSVDGVEFKENTYILLQKREGNVIDIGLIKVIALKDNKAYLVVEKYSSSFLNEFGIYKIDTAIKEVLVYETCDIKYPYVQPVYEFKDNFCFSLKHNISCTV